MIKYKVILGRARQIIEKITLVIAARTTGLGPRGLMITRSKGELNVDKYAVIQLEWGLVTFMKLINQSWVKPTTLILITYILQQI